MALTCVKCSRVNPDGAFYCYNDGNVIGHHARNGGPASAGNAPFSTTFVLPSGRSCRNFDELAIACNEDWLEAKQLLEKGFLESFLGGLGRVDLAQAAREAAHFPDRDRGLDQFLTRLPSHVLDVPKLRVEPKEVSLGILQVGQDRKFELVLENQGMRLLYGSVTVDGCAWMALGDAPGAPQKLFQFGKDLTIPVLVKGKQLRANAKPQEGRLIVESNGGHFTVIVKVEVPVKPFPAGPLADAKSPRQVAEKAKANPKEAAPLFEKGAVAQWYKANGWIYPVRGPSSSGLGAVQQFFEALGLTPPPKVQIDQTSVNLTGAVGVNLKHLLKVSTVEKRPVYAHGTSSEPWLEVGRARLNGQFATILLVIPAVPNKSGETLKAKVTVTSNGNQRFVIPVTLTIGENFDFTSDTIPAIAQETVREVPAPKLPTPTRTPAVAVPVRVRVPRQSGFGGITHLIPALLLFLALLGVVGFDLLPRTDPGSIQGPIGPTGPRWTNLADTEPRIQINFVPETLRFGIVMTKAKDSQNPSKSKRLTRYEAGESSNVCVKADDHDYVWGTRTGLAAFEKNKKQSSKQTQGPWASTFKLPEEVYVTQTIEIVPGDQTRLLDTCLVRYTLENRAPSHRTVGLRVMLDTFIDPNDGAPFVIPGHGLINTKKTIIKDIPDYIQVLEKPDLKNPGTVVHIGLRGFTIPFTETIPEQIEKVVVTRWPPSGFTARWVIDETAMNVPENDPDSCVVLYWPIIRMNPGETREMAYTYGLNSISSEASGNAKLSITAGGSFRPGSEFTATVYVTDASKGQDVELRLPDGLEFSPNEKAKQKIAEDAPVGQVSWKVRSKKPGDFILEALSAGGRETYKVKVRDVTLLK